MRRRTRLLALSGLSVAFGLVVSQVRSESGIPGSTFQAAPSIPVPSMIRMGPYGSPLQLAPGLVPGVATPLAPFLARNSADLATGPRQVDRPARMQVVPSESRIGPDEDDDEDDDRPVRPGTLTLNPVKIPTYDWRVQPKPVAPHLTPDVTYDLNSRTTIGLYNDTSKVDVKTGTALGSVLGTRSGLGSALDAKTGTGLLPSVRARDLGAGITLQYRFGN